jgi:nitrogen fixation/metabolism regulation signal transduction histidine kinase
VQPADHSSVAVRTAALFIFAAAVAALATAFAVSRVDSDFKPRSARHLAGEVASFRGEIAHIEQELDENIDHVAGRVAANPNPSRSAWFAMLRGMDRVPNRGVRIEAPSGEPIAWRGEDLRVNGNTAYEFDATNLYVIREKALPSRGVVLQAFQRIRNQPKQRSLFDPDDDWIAGTVFHAGALRQEPGSARFVLEKRPDATLYIDVVPRAKSDVIAATKALGIDIAVALLAVGALVVLGMIGPRRSTTVTVLLVLLARVALLPFRVDQDPWRIFRFDLYASRILGPFSRSPFDLLATAAAVLAIAVALTRRRPASMLAQAVRTIVAGAAAYGFTELAQNLVANSRISAVPDHIVPTSAAQGVLLAALLLFGFALLQITRHESGIARTLAAVAVAAIPLLAAGARLGGTAGHAFAWVAAAVMASLLLHAATRDRTLRILSSAVLLVAVVYMPLQLFERASARNFIANTYAPLVVGEAGQLRTMIEDILAGEFSHRDLSTMLPDDVRKMNLEDLAYALWLRSDLSKLRIPAVITVHDMFDHPISRFGVGLPQFDERRAAVGSEVLLLGSLRRVLIHHDFDLSVGSMPLGEGSVHVVNPADPGSTTFADVYRDFFEPAFEDTTTGLHPEREPVVFDRTGNAHGSTMLRLPQSPAWYFAALKPGHGVWTDDGSGSAVYIRRTEDALYAFPLQVPTPGQQVRRAGGVTIWAIAIALAAMAVNSLPKVVALLRRMPVSLDFRTRTAVYLTAVVVVPLILFVLFVRAYLANRLETEYLDRGTTALNAAQRVVEDYLASSTSSRPEQVLDDDVLSWLARVIGHDLHLYRDDRLIASSRRDLFAARIESQRLPGEVYDAIVLGGSQLKRASRTAGQSRYEEIYSPIHLAPGQNYTLALPFIVQGRQIEAQVNDLATTIYMLLVFIVLGSIAVAYRTARSVTRPVQALVGGARAVARGDFDVDLSVPSDPDLGLLVTTFRDMAQSIRRQQDELRHQRDRLQTLLENINAAVVVLDGQGRVSETNAAARKLFGDDVVFPAEVREVLARHQPRHVESEELELTVDGNARTFRVSIIPLPESAEEMVIAEDVTEILRSNRLEAWGEMAQQVAHEIKNPLTPIQLTAEHLRALAERDDPNLPAVVRSAVDNILRQVVTLRETSKEFGDYASLRQVRKKPLPFRQLLEEIAASYADSGERGIDFRADIAPTTPETVPGDARLLRGAIANLIENAFQAAPGGRVRLGSYGVDSKAVVNVEDSGPGVSPELLSKIFDPYFSTKTSGTGLGLAIARKAIEEHGGAMHAENLNPGFRISIELPAR